MGTNHYFLTRKYHKCASSPDLKRTISYCTKPGGDILGNIALIQYYFTEQEHAFAVKPHGNAKKNKVPYTRTQESTKTLLRSNLTNTTPNEACQKTTRDLGGTLNAKSAGCMPRNRKQAYNMKQMNPGISQESQSKDVLGGLLIIVKDQKWGNFFF